MKKEVKTNWKIVDKYLIKVSKLFLKQKIITQTNLTVIISCAWLMECNLCIFVLWNSNTHHIESCYFAYRKLALSSPTVLPKKPASFLGMSPSEEQVNYASKEGVVHKCNCFLVAHIILYRWLCKGGVRWKCALIGIILMWFAMDDWDVIWQTVVREMRMPRCPALLLPKS